MAGFGGTGAVRLSTEGLGDDAPPRLSLVRGGVVAEGPMKEPDRAPLLLNEVFDTRCGGSGPRPMAHRFPQDG